MELEDWVRSELQAPAARLRPLSGDAGFRRYYRCNTRCETAVHTSDAGADGSQWVIMDASADLSSCAPFLRMAKLLGQAGLNVPAPRAVELGRGWMILPDLGEQTFLDVLDAANADALFAEAITALIRLQLIPPPADLPQYDEALLRRELELFPEWHLKRHLGLAIDPPLRRLLDGVFDQLIAMALAQPAVLVHRDYMPRNLMCAHPGPGVLDFQDAVVGPISYDIVSLFRDAFISWPDERVAGWLEDYRKQALAAGLPVPTDRQQFQRDADAMGAQRHLKVIGIFARICYRDGKPHYLTDVPRFVGYLRDAVARQPELDLLGQLVARVWGEPAL